MARSSMLRWIARSANRPKSRAEVASRAAARRCARDVIQNRPELRRKQERDRQGAQSTSKMSIEPKGRAVLNTAPTRAPPAAPFLSRRLPSRSARRRRSWQRARRAGAHDPRRSAPATPIARRPGGSRAARRRNTSAERRATGAAKTAARRRRCSETTSSSSERPQRRRPERTSCTLSAEIAQTTPIGSTGSTAKGGGGGGGRVQPESSDANISYVKAHACTTSVLTWR